MTPPTAQPASNARTPGELAGRRRAQLLQGDPRAIAGAAPSAGVGHRLSVADVHELRSNPSVGARAALAAKFGRQYDSLVEAETRPLAEAVLQLLVKDLEKSVRQTLAETLAASPTCRMRSRRASRATISTSPGRCSSAVPCSAMRIW